jgi:putative endonuclease
MMTNKARGTLYIGVTSDLSRRVWQHKAKAIPGFTSRYGLDRLVWFETHEEAESAFIRETRLKTWKRDWKINLIEGSNPHWIDLYAGVVP